MCLAAVQSAYTVTLSVKIAANSKFQNQQILEKLVIPSLNEVLFEKRENPSNRPYRFCRRMAVWWRSGLQGKKTIC